MNVGHTAHATRMTQDAVEGEQAGRAVRRAAVPLGRGVYGEARPARWKADGFGPCACRPQRPLARTGYGVQHGGNGIKLYANAACLIIDIQHILRYPAAQCRHMVS